MIRDSRIYGLVLPCLLALNLLGCASGGLSGAGSMRVEVEVYKGPLSKEPELQYAELLGIRDEASSYLMSSHDFIVSVALGEEIFGENAKYKLKKYDGDNEELKELVNVIRSRSRLANIKEIGKDGKLLANWCRRENPSDWWPVEYYDCLILAELYYDLVELFYETQATNWHGRPANLYQSTSSENGMPMTPKASRRREEAVRECNEIRALIEEQSNKIPDQKTCLMRESLKQITRLSAIFRTKAMRWATHLVPGHSFDRTVRVAVTNFVSLASEKGNDLQARADALMKQIGGHDRRELPLSVYLRDTDPTDFIRLYDWHNAAMPDLVGDNWVGIGSTEDRIKGVKRLFVDQYWSKINTVHASGRGTFRLALIKDDIGNWNLKSFDNDPEELLNAYKDFSLTAIERAAALAGKIGAAASTGGGLSEIGGLLDMAAEVALGGGGGGVEPASSIRTQHFHDAMKAKLVALATKFEDKDAPLRKAFEKEKIGSDSAAQARSALDANRKTFAQEASQALHAYEQMIDIMLTAAPSTAVPDASGGTSGAEKASSMP